METDFFTGGDDFLKSKNENNLTQKPIHVSIKQRTVRKCYTLIHNIPEDIDLKLLVKEWKARFNCAGSNKKEKQTGEEYIELFGDHRNEVRDFLIAEGIGYKDKVIIHGS